MKEVYSLEVRHKLDASHQLTDSDYLVTKACARLHGHTYGFRVFVEDRLLNPAGMVVDFKAIKEILDRFDHRHLNDVLEEYNFHMQPTAENLAKVISVMIFNELRLNAEVWVAEGYKGEEWSSWAKYKCSIDE
jgi:6-pyruvoyl tetrahydropterin synthase/QueD family protein